MDIFLRVQIEIEKLLLILENLSFLWLYNFHFDKLLCNYFQLEVFINLSSLGWRLLGKKVKSCIYFAKNGSK